MSPNDLRAERIAALPSILYHNGQRYLRIGDKAVPLTPRPGDIRSTREEREGGRVDVTMHVPCLRIMPRGHGPG